MKALEVVEMVKAKNFRPKTTIEMKNNEFYLIVESRTRRTVYRINAEKGDSTKSLVPLSLISSLNALPEDC